MEVKCIPVDTQSGSIVLMNAQKWCLSSSKNLSSLSASQSINSIKNEQTHTRSKQMQPSTSESTAMKPSKTLIPCYAGPKDGAFFPEDSCPLGYKRFEVRGKIVFLFSEVKVEYINFNILSKASKIKPSAFDDIEDLS